MRTTIVTTIQVPTVVRGAPVPTVVTNASASVTGAAVATTTPVPTVVKGAPVPVVIRDPGPPDAIRSVSPPGGYKITNIRMGSDKKVIITYNSTPVP
jgi:hypothetical protein